MKTIHLALLVFLCSALASLALVPFDSHSRSAKTQPLDAKKIEQWRTDLEVMQQQLEQRHIHLYHKINADAFNKELARIKQALPTLSETHLTIELMRLIKQVGDGHTQFAYWGGEHHRYPLELRMFDGQLRVIGIDANYAHLQGALLVAINDTPIERVQVLLTPVLQGVENIHSEQQRLVETITVAEILYGLNIADNLQQAQFTFTLPEGEQQKINLHSLTIAQLQAHNISSMPYSTPVNFIKHSLSIDGVALLLGKEKPIAYLDFYRYPTFSAMEKFAERLITLLQKQQTTAVIIDLRNNSGGDFFVGLQLAWALIMVDNLNWRAGIYVLTGRKTFSAAMSNAAQYRQLLNAKLVGEPTGANPVGYQDAGTFSLPHSGWTVMYSKRFYRFQDADTAGVIPDIIINEKWDDYQQGKNRALEWVLRDIQRRERKHH